MDTERRSMRVAGSAMIAGAATILAAGSAAACGEQLPGATRRIEDASYEIVFRSAPAAIETGKYFSLDFAVCPRGGSRPPDEVRVDAVMPEHRHGMNYRPVVAARGTGLYRADGLMFHMPGRWEIRFDVVTAAGVDRLVATTQLE
jgi:YtkA-like